MTNIYGVHLAEGQFGSLDEIFNEKRKLVDALKEDGIAILNTDNHFLENLNKSRSKKTTINFGKNKEANFWASRINSTIEGTNFVLNYKEKRYQVSSPVLGKYQIYVLLPAIICGLEMGMEMENAILALNDLVYHLEECLLFRLKTTLLFLIVLIIPLHLLSKKLWKY